MLFKVHCLPGSTSKTTHFSSTHGREKAPCPKAPPSLHLITSDKGFPAFLTLPKILMLGSHKAHHESLECHRDRATKGESSRSQKPHWGIRSGTQPASQLALYIRLQEPLLVQFLPQQKFALPNHPHTAQSSCATSHATTSAGESHVNRRQAKG